MDPLDSEKRQEDLQVVLRKSIRAHEEQEARDSKIKSVSSADQDQRLNQAMEECQDYFYSSQDQSLLKPAIGTIRSLHFNKSGIEVND